jgi:hypothetical protein
MRCYRSEEHRVTFLENVLPNSIGAVRKDHKSNGVSLLKDEFVRVMQKIRWGVELHFRH